MPPVICCVTESSLKPAHQLDHGLARTASRQRSGVDNPVHGEGSPDKLGVCQLLTFHPECPSPTSASEIRVTLLFSS